MNNILKYEIIPLLDIKNYFRIREINKNINNLILINLPKRLEKEDIIIDTEFAKKYKEYVLGKNVNTFEFYFQYNNYINWNNIVEIKLTEKFLLKYFHEFDTNTLYKILYTQPKLSESFVNKIVNKILFDSGIIIDNYIKVHLIDRVIKNQKVFENFIEKYIDIDIELDWNYIFENNIKWKDINLIIQDYESLYRLLANNNLVD
jgi:hypothetical protein